MYKECDKSMYEWTDLKFLCKYRKFKDFIDNLESMYEWTDLKFLYEYRKFKDFINIIGVHY